MCNFTSEQLRTTKNSLRTNGEQCNNYKSETFQFLLEEYKICHQKASHYDSLTWILGGLLTVVSTLATALGWKTEGASGLETFLIRLPIAVLAIVLLISWLLIYERNRGWVEILNERIKDIERNLGVYGIGSYLSVGAWQKGIWRENNEREALAQMLHFPPQSGSPFRLGSLPMHILVWSMVIALAILAAFVCVFPLLQECLFK